MSVVPCRSSSSGPRVWSAQSFQRWRDLAPVGLASEPVGDHKNILVRGEETRGDNHVQQKPQATQGYNLLSFIMSG